MAHRSPSGRPSLLSQSVFAILPQSAAEFSVRQPAVPGHGGSDKPTRMSARNPPAALHSADPRSPGRWRRNRVRTSLEQSFFFESFKQNVRVHRCVIDCHSGSLVNRVAVCVHRYLHIDLLGTQADRGGVDTRRRPRGRDISGNCSRKQQ